MYNEPAKVALLSAYNDKTDVILGFEKCDGDFELAFQDYHRGFCPFVEECQTNAEEFFAEFLVPRTAEAIRARNAQAQLA